LTHSSLHIRIIAMASQTMNATLVYDSSARTSAALEEAVQAWRYRDLILFLVRRDITARYKRSVLGVAWTMLNPLGMMVVLSIVFSQVFRVGMVNYPGFVLSGLIAWTFFSQASTAAINSLVWGGDLFSRIYVPRSVFAISAIGTGLVNLCLSMVPLLLIMAIMGTPPHPTLLLAPIAMLLLALFTLGVGLLISTIGIYFIDVVEMYAIILMAWMYLTPVIYPMNILPESVQFWVRLNPMVHLVDVFRMLVFYGTMPSAATWIVAAGTAVGTFLLGWLLFTGKVNEFAYRT